MTHDPTTEGLFTETLQSHAAAQPLYSVQANVLTAFFGGVFAMAIFSTLNLKRMNRSLPEFFAPVLLAIGWAVFFVWAIRAQQLGTLPDWLSIFAASESSSVRRFGSLVSLAAFGVHWVAYRHVYRSQSLAGADRPGPWPAALGSIGVAIVLSVVLALAAVGVAGV